VYLNIPDVVDVTHINIGEEQTLPEQKILSQSELEPLEL
jgi:hypothetical protein